jgi:hypothetical protein
MSGHVHQYRLLHLDGTITYGTHDMGASAHGSSVPSELSDVWIVSLTSPPGHRHKQELHRGPMAPAGSP